MEMGAGHTESYYSRKSSERREWRVIKKSFLKHIFLKI
jgi:hypothetical protein